jgi:hypothetical protein
MKYLISLGQLFHPKFKIFFYSYHFLYKALCRGLTFTNHQQVQVKPLPS